MTEDKKIEKKEREILGMFVVTKGEKKTFYPWKIIFYICLVLIVVYINLIINEGNWKTIKFLFPTIAVCILGYLIGFTPLWKKLNKK